MKVFINAKSGKCDNFVIKMNKLKVKFQNLFQFISNLFELLYQFF